MQTEYNSPPASSIAVHPKRLGHLPEYVAPPLHSPLMHARSVQSVPDYPQTGYPYHLNLHHKSTTHHLSVPEWHYIPQCRVHQHKNFCRADPEGLLRLFYFCRTSDY